MIAFGFLAAAWLIVGLYFVATAAKNWWWSIPLYGVGTAMMALALFLATGAPRPLWMSPDPVGAIILSYSLDEPNNAIYLWVMYPDANQPVSLTIPFTMETAQEVVDAFAEMQEGEGLPVIADGPNGIGVEHPEPPAAPPVKSGG